MEFNLSALSKEAKSVENEQVKVLILGAGPAGMSAALYAARAELRPVVLTGLEPGGQASLTYLIENYPGFPDGIGGLKLGELFQQQAEHFGARFDFETASSVDLSKRPFVVKTTAKDYLTEVLIIATGASANRLNVPGESKLTGKGVSYCATCDGCFFKNKKVVVVGGGDSAIEEAIFLTRYVDHVNIIHRRDSLRAGAVLQKRAFENPKISFTWNSIVTEVLGDRGVSGVRIRDIKTNEETILPTDGVFIFIGNTPNTQLFNGQLEMDEKGYLVVDRLMRTHIPGVFAAGEVADPHFRQVVTSAGMGAAAAIQATRYLQENQSS